MESFVTHAISIAVSQICLKAGWDSIHRSSLDTIVHVTRKYIEEIASTSATFTHLTGRTDVNLLDIKNALNEFDVHFSELIKYHKDFGQLPFAKPLPSVPIRKPPILCHPAFDVFPLPPEMVTEDKEDPSKKLVRPPYVPSFMPAFPDKRTYLSTPVFVGQERDRKTIRKRKVQENILVEKSLTKLHRASSLQISPGMAVVQRLTNDKPIRPVNYQIEQSRLDPFSNRTYLWGKAKEKKNQMNLRKIDMIIVKKEKNKSNKKIKKRKRDYHTDEEDDDEGDEEDDDDNEDEEDEEDEDREDGDEEDDKENEREEIKKGERKINPYLIPPTRSKKQFGGLTSLQSNISSNIRDNYKQNNNNHIFNCKNQDKRRRLIMNTFDHSQ